MMNAFTKFKSDIFKYASVQLLSKGLSLLASYIIAFLSTNEIFGYIALIQASFLVVITIFGFNLQSGFVRYYFTCQLSEILNKTFPIFVILLFLSFISSLAIFIFLDFNDNYKLFFLLPVIGFLAGIGFIISILARSNNNFKIYAVSELIRPVLIISIAISLFFIKFDIISAYISTLFISSFLVFVYGLLNYKKLLNLDVIIPEKLTTKIILLYTFPLFLSQIMSLINNVSDRYLLNYYLDIEKVGLYSKAYIFGSSLGLLFDSLMLLWVPYAIKNKSIIFEQYYNRILKIFNLIMLVSFIVFLIAIFNSVFNFEFLGVDNNFLLVFLLIISAFICRIGYQILTPILNAYDKTAIVAKCSIVSMLIGLVFNLIFIPYMGIIAAALSTLISFLFFSLSSLFFTKKLYQDVCKYK